MSSAEASKNAASAQNEGANKLAAVVKPIVELDGGITREHITALYQEIIIAIGKVEARLDVVEKMIAGSKKATVRNEKKVAVAAEGEAEADVAGPSDTIPVNKNVFFRRFYENSEDFRTRYTTAEMVEAMAKNPAIIGKKDAIQKLKAEANFCYAHIRTNDSAAMTRIETEYAALKAENAAKAKPPQQVVEPDTPVKAEK